MASNDVDRQVAELIALIEVRRGPLESLYNRLLHKLDADTSPEEAIHERPPCPPPRQAS